VGSGAEDVERELMELLEEVNSFDGKDALKAAAYLHSRFEWIHSFVDGNGRVAACY
jgi:Fic family protein